MRLLFVAALSLIATGIFYYLYTVAVYSRWRISSAEARQRLAKGEFDVVLDVRTAAERTTLGAYPGSIHLPAAEITRVLTQFPNKETAILIYCNTGHRARLATDKLIALGYKNTRYISSSHLSLLH